MQIIYHIFILGAFSLLSAMSQTGVAAAAAESHHNLFSTHDDDARETREDFRQIILDHGKELYERGLKDWEGKDGFGDQYSFEGKSIEVQRYLILDAADGGVGIERFKEIHKDYLSSTKPDTFREREFRRFLDWIIESELMKAFTVKRGQQFRSDDKFVQYLGMYFYHYDGSVGAARLWDPRIVLGGINFSEFDSHAWIIDNLYYRALNYYVRDDGVLEIMRETETKIYELTSAHLDPIYFDYHAALGNLSFIAQIGGEPEAALQLVEWAAAFTPTTKYNEFALEIRRNSVLGSLGEFEKALVGYSRIIDRLETSHLDPELSSLDLLASASYVHAAYIAAVLGLNADSLAFLDKYETAEVPIEASNYYPIALFILNANIENDAARAEYALQLQKLYFNSIFDDRKSTNSGKTGATHMSSISEFYRPISQKDIAALFPDAEFASETITSDMEQAKTKLLFWLGANTSDSATEFRNIIWKLFDGNSNPEIWQWAHAENNAERAALYSRLAATFIEEGSELSTLESDVLLFWGASQFAKGNYEEAYRAISILNGRQNKNPKAFEHKFELRVFEMIYAFQEGHVSAGIKTYIDIQNQFGSELGFEDQAWIGRALSSGLRDNRHFSHALEISTIFTTSQRGKDHSIPSSLVTLHAQLLLENDMGKSLKPFVDVNRRHVTELADAADLESTMLLYAGFNESAAEFSNAYDKFKKLGLDKANNTRFLGDNLGLIDDVSAIRTMPGDSVLVKSKHSDWNSELKHRGETILAAQARQNIIREDLAAQTRKIQLAQAGIENQQQRNTVIITSLMILSLLLIGALSVLALKLREASQRRAEYSEKIDELSSGIAMAGRLGEYHSGKIRKLLPAGKLGEDDAALNAAMDQIDSVETLWSDLGRLASAKLPVKYDRKKMSGSFVARTINEEFGRHRSSGQTELRIETADQKHLFVCERYLLSSAVQSVMKFMCLETPVGEITAAITVEDGDQAYLHMKFKDEGMGTSVIKAGIDLEEYWNMDGPAEVIGLSIMASVIEGKGGSFAHNARIGSGNEIELRVPIKITGPKTAREIGNDNVVQINVMGT